MKIKTKDRYDSIATILISFALIVLLITTKFLWNFDLKSNILYYCMIGYAVLAIIRKGYIYIRLGIRMHDDYIYIGLSEKNKKNTKLFNKLFLSTNLKESFNKYIINYKDIKEYGIYDNNIYFIIKNKTKIHFDESKITNKDRKLLFNDITKHTNIKPLYESDFIVNYKDYDKYGKVVKSKQVDVFTKYEIRLKDGIYRVLIFKKIYTDDFKHYKEYENGLNVVWEENSQGDHLAKDLKSAIKIAEEYSK